MKTITSVLFVSLISHTTVFAQEGDEKALPFVKITDVFVNLGSTSEKTNDGDFDDFKTLAPNSQLLLNKFETYLPSDGNYSSNGFRSLSLGMKFRNKDGSAYLPNPLLRIGIKYFGSTNLGYTLHKESRNRIDTLTSSGSSEVVYLDSVKTSQLWMEHNSEQIRFDASIIFRTNPEARWSIYGGIGLSAGLSFMAQTHISKHNFNSVEFHYQGETAETKTEHGEHDNFDHETFTNKSGFGASIHLPMGLDFRLGKESKFWKMIHLYYEIQPAVNMVNIPELETYTNTKINHGFGLRVNW